MVEHAICIRCGDEKAFPLDRCGSCRLVPQTKDEKRKSFYLSEYRFEDGDEMERWLEELETIAPRLKQPAPFDYDAKELERMDSVELKVMADSKRWLPMFRYFLGPAILLAVLWGIVVILRLLR